MVVALVTPVPAPVIVIVCVPGATVAATATVIVDVKFAPDSVAGLAVTVTPVGSPLLVRVTSPVKLVRTSVAVVVPDAPAATERVVGATLSAMLDDGGAVTVTVRVAVAFATPVPVPVIVIVLGPTGTAAPTSTVIVDVVPVALCGLNDTFIPFGWPVAVSATAPVKLVRVIVRALVADWPCAMLSVAGASANAMVGVTGAVTVTVSVAD